MVVTLIKSRGSITTKNKKPGPLRRVVILLDADEPEVSSEKYLFLQEWRNCKLWPLRHFGAWHTVMEKEFSSEHRVADVENVVATWAWWADAPIVHEKSLFPACARLVYCKWW